LSEPFDLPEAPPPLEPDEPPAARPRQFGLAGGLPWLLAAISVATLAAVTLYGKKVVDEQAARTIQAQRLAEEYGARTGRLEQDRKDALRQSMDLSQKLDEVTAARTSLADQLKEKESALASLNQRHETLVNELRSALRTAKGKALPKRVSQALAHDASASAPVAGAPTATRPHPPRHSP
jgi:peptidoglycan hydrolase CwlO-like protein